MPAQIIRELDNFAGLACLVKVGDRHFVVSSVSVFGVPETLAFRSNEKGKVTRWHEVAGGRYASRTEVIAQLESGNLYEWDEDSAREEEDA